MALVPIERQVNVATVAARLRQQMGLKDAATKEASEFATAAEGLLATTALQPESPLAAGNLTGTIDLARIPVMPGNEQIVSSAGIAALTTEQQAVVLRGSIVTTTDGRRWVYTGSGSKISEASYIVLADVTPDWSAVSGKPTFGDAAAKNTGTTAGTVAAGDDERIVNAVQLAAVGVASGVPSLNADIKVTETQLSLRETLGDNLDPTLAYRGYTELNTWTKTNFTAASVDGAIQLTASGTDPKISIGGLSIIGSVNRYLFIRYRITSGTQDPKVFWSTSGHGFDGSNVANLPIHAGLNVWQTVVLDMWNPSLGGTDWKTNTITGLRLDLVAVIGNQVEVSAIGVCADKPRLGTGENDARYVYPASAGTNQLPRSNGAGSYNWASVLFKRQQGGQLDLGAAYAVMAHTGPENALVPSDLNVWYSRNGDTPEAGVNGFLTDSVVATYQGIGSVSLYVDIAAPPPVATLPGTFTTTTWVPSAPLTSDVLSKMFVGQYLYVPTGTFWGKITAFNANLVTVSAWYANGNTAAGQSPSGTQNVVIGVVTKVWALNANVLLGEQSRADQGIGFELGAGNWKSSYDLATGTGAQANGLNIVSLGPFNNHWALLITRQPGDGTWARGVYVAGTTYASFTAGTWAGDTTAPAYGFQYNFNTGKAFAINGSVGGGAERFYVDGLGNIYSTANVGLGFAPTANNRLIAQGYGTAGATNSIVGKNSSGATTFTVRDNGLVIMGAFTVANLPSSGVAAGSEAYATNGRRGGQAVGAGTGVKVFYDGTGNWIACDTGQAVAA